MTDRIRIVEVGPRDGLQNESKPLDAAIKIDLINQLSDTGLSMIEATSFVSPKSIPQLADAEQVFTGIDKKPGVAYPVLVPNLQGLARATAVHAKHVAVFTTASESFAQKNIRQSVGDSLKNYEAVVKQAKADGLWVRGYLSCVMGCPYEGPISPAKTLEVAHALINMGVDELSLGDTIGVGTPKQTRELIELFTRDIPLEKIALHCHDTYGQALANIEAALECGVRIFDASVAGLGGCPYAKGSTGNVATEDVLYMLHGMGYETGVDLDKLIAVGFFITEKLSVANKSKVALASIKTI